VSGNLDGAEMLLNLEKANLFLVALDEERTWYRYHTLFADLLQKQLRSRMPAQVPELHRRASQWYTQNRFPGEAVSQALKSGDWNYAADKVENEALSFIQNGQIPLVRQWMEHLPADVIRSRPLLCIAQALTSTKYATVALAEDLLQQAEAALTNNEGNFDKEIYEFVSTQIAVLQVVIARARGDSTQKQQELALEAIENLHPGQDPASQATLYLRLGFSYLDQGEDELADQTFSQAFDLGQASGNYYAAHGASYGRMVIAKRHGALQKLNAICQQTLASVPDQNDYQRSLTGIALTMSATLHYEWNDLKRAETMVEQGLTYLRQVGLTELIIKGKYVQACMEISQAEMEALPDLTRIAERSSPGLGFYAAALQMRLHVLMHQKRSKELVDEVHLWVDQQQPRLRNQPTYDWEVFEMLVAGRVLNLQFEKEPNPERSARLDRYCRFIEAQIQPLHALGWHGSLIEVYAVLALLHQSLNRMDEALRALSKALELGKGQRFVRTFLDEGPSMRKLLQAGLARGIHPEYIHRLLAAYDPPGESPRVDHQAGRADMVEPLSEREMQVLRLLNSQLSVPQIAAEIHLAPTTVRTHVQHIYQKLGVHGRIEALKRAEETGLL
jgi:LuxR family maltose regulon positive regulatory protein